MFEQLLWLLPLLGVGTQVLFLQKWRRNDKRDQLRKRDKQVASRADRDHSRTLRGDPRGMYGKYELPPEFVAVTDDDQFVDEWDKCELCPKRGRAQAVSDKGKPLGTGPNKPVAVFSGTTQAPVAPMRLCRPCYRECAYGAKYHTVDAAVAALLPIPKPADFDANLRAWLDAEGTWIEAVDDWLEAEKRWEYSEKMRGWDEHRNRQRDPANNVTDFQEAAKRLGHDMAMTHQAPSFAVGAPTPALRANDAFTNMLAKLVAIGALPGVMIGLEDAERDCPGCERVYMQGEPRPARVVCTGGFMCQKKQG